MQLIRLVQGDDQSAPVPYLVVDPVAEKGYGVNMHMLLRYDAPIAVPAFVLPRSGTRGKLPVPGTSVTRLLGIGPY